MTKIKSIREFEVDVDESLEGVALYEAISKSVGVGDDSNLIRPAVSFCESQGVPETCHTPVKGEAMDREVHYDVVAIPSSCYQPPLPTPPIPPRIKNE